MCDETHIDIGYKPFHSHESTFGFSPYFMKEYKNRWFVIGKKDDIDDISTIALDRITAMRPTPKVKFDRSRYVTPDDLYADCIGVTANIGSPVETVTFDVSPSEAGYLETKPLHRSQQTCGENADGTIRFSLRVRINNELIRELRTFGRNLRVVPPASLIPLI